MNNHELSPQYLRIALDLAKRIAEGEMKAGQRFSGRSLLASEYAVSPETIRRALKLLADMKVVTIKDKSGVFILSADNARRYLKNFQDWNEQIELQKKLKDLFLSYNKLNREIADVYTEIIRAQEAASPAMKPLANYEVRVYPSSERIGMSIGALKFWQSTAATVIAIRRGHNMILSPGPYAELYADDVIVFVGDASTVASVERFINGDCRNNIQEPKEEVNDSI